MPTKLTSVINYTGIILTSVSCLFLAAALLSNDLLWISITTCTTILGAWMTGIGSWMASRDESR